MKKYKEYLGARERLSHQQRQNPGVVRATLSCTAYIAYFPEAKDCHPTHSRSLVGMLLHTTNLTPETPLQVANDIFCSGTCAVVQSEGCLPVKDGAVSAEGGCSRASRVRQHQTSWCSICTVPCCRGERTSLSPAYKWVRQSCLFASLPKTSHPKK